MQRILILFSLWLLCMPVSISQTAGYWQQRVEYTMEVDLDHTKHQYQGKQKLVYYNNSPDTLHRVFYHLYFNAFQPGSEMDIRNQILPDSDKRVKGRIGALKPEEQGWYKIKTLTQNGKEVRTKVVGTVLEVDLASPILPGSTAQFDMQYTAQIPIQIRRSGRNSSEGIDYSMSQWYPKMAEYDHMGWHADPYIGREFHGVWGDFDVTIYIDKSYTIGATGYLQNPNEVGKGYENGPVKSTEGDKIKWHFKAPQVHDFAWGADPDYVHKKVRTPDGIDLHFFYQENPSYKAAWEQLPEKMLAFFDLMQAKFGKYPYKQYSFVQGGDGGMEYPMMTLITGNRGNTSLVGVSVHEAVHSWFHGVLATNELLYPWMDEGFTTYASNYIMDKLYAKNALNPYRVDFESYKEIEKHGYREILCTHADWYHTNYGYGVAAYSSGSVFLTQLNYIVGEEIFNKSMLKFYDTWKFKHPTPNDLIRVFEKESGMELDWFLLQFIYSMNTIDYALVNAEKSKEGIEVELKRIGNFPMPVDFVIYLKSGEKKYYTIPLDIMRGAKTKDNGVGIHVLPSWAWVNPVNRVEISDVKWKDVEKIEIDPSTRFADMDSKNNVWVKE